MRYSSTFLPGYTIEPLYIGRDGQPSGRFVGLIDEIDIYDRVLSAAEIQSIYTAGSAGKCTTPPVCVNPPSGLVNWWPGDGNTNDIQGSNHGALQNGATFASGKVGQALSFDGVDDYVEMPENGSLDLNGDFTLESWVKPEAYFVVPSPVITKYNYSGGNLANVSWQLDILNGGNVQFGIACGMNSSTDLMYQQTTNAAVPVNVFTHVAAVYRQNPPAMEIYVNGVLQAGTTNGSCSFINQNDTPVRIGRRIDSGSTAFFNGIIDEVSIYNRALSASEIQSLYNAGSAGKCKCEVTFNPAGPFCANAAAVDLSNSVSPVGGTFTGAGISGTMFEPATAGAGTHTITYTFTDANNCLSSASQDIVVNALPGVSFTAVGPFLVTDAPVDLAASASPSGGTFSGPGIAGTMFEPTTAGVGTHTITYTFTDGNGCSNGASQDIVVNPGPSLHGFVILVNDLVTINRNKKSDAKGDIHCNGAIQFNKGDPNTFTGNLTAVGNVNLNKDNTIAGNVTAGGTITLASGSTITGSATPNATVIPIAITAPPFTAGGANHTVPQNGSLTLPPGVYGNVIVGNSATLNLGTGEYRFTKLETKSASTLNCNMNSGAVEVKVTTSLKFGKKVTINITPGGETNSAQAIFTALQSTQVLLDKDGYVLGSFIAPNAEVFIGKNGSFRGAVCAKKVTVDRDVTLVHHFSPGSIPIPKASADEEGEEVASDQLAVTSYQLEQNYPNPFNPTTEITFALPEAGEVTLAIYNNSGQLVRMLVSGEKAVGRHSVVWDAKDGHGARVASGVYLYRLKAGSIVLQKKLVVMK